MRIDAIAFGLNPPEDVNVIRGGADWRGADQI